MGRLIDADAFDKRIRLDVGSCEEELTEDFKDGISTILEMMKTAPTVDAVPVEDVLALAIALNKEIEVLELSVRAYHALSRWECRTVGDVYRLLKSGKIKKVRNLGDKSIGEIEDRLYEYLPYLWRTDGRRP